jgi:tetratricopeptide (TPR) repeat protein
MFLSGNNSIFRSFVCALFLLLALTLSAAAQETQPPPSPMLEAALAHTDLAARLEALQKFLDAQPDAPQADTARAEVTRLYAFLGETQLAEKNIETALQHFKQAIAAFPKQVDDKFFDEVAARIPLAVSARGYRTEAILLARELEARFGSEAKRLAALGEFYLSVEAPTEALRALQAALKLAPDNARVYRLLGAAHRVNLNLEEAAEQYKLAIKANPKDNRAYFELANLQRARGRYENAINLYNHQLSLEPEHAPSLKGLALCHLAQGNDARAEELLAQAAKVTQADLRQDFFLQTQLALTYLARGKVTKARQAADTALLTEPRFSWARIAAAEVDLSEGKYFDSERHILAAMQYANFPTLHFLLGKIYLAVEDFEGALDEFGKAFSYKAGQFQTRLGGVLEVKADSVAELLAPERQASLFQAEAITTEVEFKLAENLTRFEDTIRGTKHSSSALVSAILMSQKTSKAALVEIEKVTAAFVETEGSRKPFRWLYAAERLTQAGQGLETVLKLTAQALEAAETATAPEGSLRDYPNYDRDGRLRVFRGRALTLRGRALVKLHRPQEAVATLEQAVESYGLAPERKRAQWQLALAKESAGQTKEALDLYIAAYEPPEKTALGSDLNRAVIEALYRKVHGSLDGLSERIGKARETALTASAKAQSKPAAPLFNVAPAPASAEKAEPKPTETPVTETTATTTPPPNIEAVTEAVKTEPAPEKALPGSPVAVETNAAAAPLTLPEARLIALMLGELANTEIPQEFALDAEDAPPPGSAVAANPDKPAEEPKAVAAPVVLPEVKPIALAIAELVPTGIQPELLLEVEDAPLPGKPAVTAENVAPTEAAKPTEAPLVLPAAPVIPYVLLPALAESSEPLWSFPDIEDPNPQLATARPSEVVPTPAAPAPARQNKAAQQTQLSDARVAEIEKAIAAGLRGGKKGDGAAAKEESAIGHIEGDIPVRSAKPLPPVLPAGESGHVAATTPKVSKENPPTLAPKSEPLPSEVEQRAKTMGQSAGKLSVDTALELDAAEKPAGRGRKGAPETAVPQRTEADDKTKGNARPRRVKDPEKLDENPQAETPSKDKKKSGNQ